MPTTNSVYNGNLRVSSTHIQSGTDLITDAPLDNNGKGESFSPTDLVCVALCNCMITIMGIVAQKETLAFQGYALQLLK